MFCSEKLELMRYLQFWRRSDYGSPIPDPIEPSIISICPTSGLHCWEHLKAAKVIVVCSYSMFSTQDEKQINSGATSQYIFPTEHNWKTTTLFFVFSDMKDGDSKHFSEFHSCHRNPAGWSFLIGASTEYWEKATSYKWI